MARKKLKFDIKPLEGYFEKIAKVFSRKDIKVVVQGDMCCTDGKTIYLPANIDDLEGADRQVAEGMLDHEWGHNALGEKDKARGEGDLFGLMEKSKSEKGLAPWLNVFDDIRLHQKCEYSGAVENMEKANKILLKKLHEKVVSKELTLEQNPIKLLGCGVIAMALDQDQKFLPLTAKKILKDGLGDIIQKAKDGLETLADVESLARAARDRLDLICEDDEGEGKGKGKPKLGGKGKGKSEIVEIRKAKEGEEINPDGPLIRVKNLRPDGDPTNNPLKEMAEETVTAAAQNDIRDHRRHISDPRVLKMDRTVKASKGNFEDLRKRVTSPAKSLKNRLVSLLRSRSLSYTSLDHERGEIDTSALYSVPCGNKRVFSQIINGQDTDVAVGILIDNSGSMHSDFKYLRAREVAGIMGEALDAIRVPFFIASWHQDYSRGWLSDQRQPFNRFVPYLFQIFKDFGERWKLVRGRLETLSPDGDNDDGGAVRWAARKLISQKAKRYILFVLSDGDPASQSPDWESMRDDLKVAVGQVMSAGIEVVGIGIKDDAVEEFYPVWLVVHNLSEFVPKVVRILKDLLTEGSQKWRQMANFS